MKEFWGKVKKYRSEILISIAVGIFLILFCFALALANGYSVGLDAQAEDVAKLDSIDAGNALNLVINQYADDAKRVVAGMPNDVESIYRYLDKEFNENIMYIRLFKNGAETDKYGNPFTEKESEQLLNIVKDSNDGKISDTVFFTGIVNDSSSNSRGFYVYLPAGYNSEIDGVALFYRADTFENDITERIKAEHSSDDVAPRYMSVCTYGGDVAIPLHSDGFLIQRYDNLYKSLRHLVSSKVEVNTIEKTLAEKGCCTFHINGEKYIICRDQALLAQDNFYVASIYRSTDVYADGFRLVNTVYTVIVLLAIILASLLGYIIYSKLVKRNKISDIDMTDPILGCPTYKRFSSEAMTTIERNKNSHFSIIYAELAHFKYITETYGGQVGEDILKFLSKLFTGYLQTGEMFCHIDNARFALLFHYKDEEHLYDRIKIINSIVHNYPLLPEKSSNMKLRIGIYYVDLDKNESIQHMVDRAIAAQKSNYSLKVGNLSIFDTRIEEETQNVARIESIMYSALKNGEFKVFYQPKYNIAQNRVDGAEALVRWYDAKEEYYRSPAEFIPLFEANGFISLLDRYVFEEVCKYYRNSVENGYKLVPISVNVSRVSATQSDFLDFYINNKNRYGVANGFITIEFTESFAYENYEVLKKLVTRLSENGFKCSIDDFGSGYSSYNVLKALPMNELKLDKFFIQPGISQERDDILLETMIKLAKSLDMKVTQEGVETIDDARRLAKLGCDVIQGYIYSKPLTATDYISFIADGKMSL